MVDNRKYADLAKRVVKAAHNIVTTKSPSKTNTQPKNK